MIGSCTTAVAFISSMRSQSKRYRTKVQGDGGGGTARRPPRSPERATVEPRVAPREAIFASRASPQVSLRPAGRAMADDEKTKEQIGAGCGVCMIKPWTKDGLIGSKNYDYSYLCMPT
eukprot:scaffold26564_cov101-Isochrysis_galbana.AAC.4